MENKVETKDAVEQTEIDPQRQVELGKAIAELLGLQKNERERYDTTIGDKTPLGLYLTLKRYIEDDDVLEPETEEIEDDDKEDVVEEPTEEKKTDEGIVPEDSDSEETKINKLMESDKRKLKLQQVLKLKKKTTGIPKKTDKKQSEDFDFAGGSEHFDSEEDTYRKKNENTVNEEVKQVHLDLHGFPVEGDQQGKKVIKQLNDVLSKLGNFSAEVVARKKDEDSDYLPFIIKGKKTVEGSLPLYGVDSDKYSIYYDAYENFASVLKSAGFKVKKFDSDVEDYGIDITIKESVEEVEQTQEEDAYTKSYKMMAEHFNF